MRISFVATLLLLTATVPATAQLTIGISIGAYPNFRVMPGYAAYYAPDVGANYFFYDGYYWVYQDDNWYSSSWYNGPWQSVGPMYVPIEVLQIPVRYYRRPPQYFMGWQADRPPRWNDHWGHDWAQRRQDWDRPRQSSHPAPAPLPDYQRRYSGRDYPRAEQQQVLQQQNYRYHPQYDGHPQNDGAKRDSGRQSDERRSGPAQPNIQQQPTQQDRPSRPEHRDPQQDQRQPSAPRPDQPRAPAAHEPGNSGAADRRPHDNQPGEAGKKQGKDRNRDREQKQDKDQNQNRDVKKD